jgi:hypothetical protein
MVATVLSFPVFGLWLFYRTISCAANVSQFLCDWSFTAPVVLGGAVIVSFVGILWMLSNYERDMGVRSAMDRPSTRNPVRFAADTRRGYRQLHTPHRKHVRRHFFLSAIFLGEVTGFWTFYFGAPALASMIAGIIVVLLVIAFNTWVRMGESRDFLQ